MSKASKNRAKQKRKMQKKARKESKKLLYAKYAQEGKEKQTKRARKQKKKLVNAHPHAIDYCGNPGCNRCHPELNIDKKLFAMV